MGNHIAPPLAIVFMDRLEKRMLVTAEVKLECYGRNMDNIISIFLSGNVDTSQFVDHCNIQHPSITFTSDMATISESGNFMDIDISIGSDRTISYEIYQKLSDSSVNLNYRSQVPEQVKMAVATSKFTTATRISSS